MKKSFLTLLCLLSINFLFANCKIDGLWYLNNSRFVSWNFSKNKKNVSIKYVTGELKEFPFIENEKNLQIGSKDGISWKFNIMSCNDKYITLSMNGEIYLLIRQKHKPINENLLQEYLAKNIFSFNHKTATTERLIDFYSDRLRIAEKTDSCFTIIKEGKWKLKSSVLGTRIFVSKRPFSTVIEVTDNFILVENIETGHSIKLIQINHEIQDNSLDFMIGNWLFESEKVTEDSIKISFEKDGNVENTNQLESKWKWEKINNQIVMTLITSNGAFRFNLIPESKDLLKATKIHCDCITKYYADTECDEWKHTSWNLRRI